MNVKGYRGAFGRRLDSLSATFFAPKGSFFLTGIILLLVLAIALSNGEKQPIAFNHKKHSENNIQCFICHPSYQTSAQAGIPNVEICLSCHEDVLNVSAEKQKLLSYMRSRESISWLQVYRVPDHVLFSHRRHVVAGKLGCVECHADVAQMAEPITAQARDLSMNGCIKCHVNVYLNPNECISCHK